MPSIQYYVNILRRLIHTRDNFDSNTPQKYINKHMQQETQIRNKIIKLGQRPMNQKYFFELEKKLFEGVHPQHLLIDQNRPVAPSVFHNSSALTFPEPV